ncbi:MAG: DUF6476 family protein [Pseudomonadota bacterium]
MNDPHEPRELANLRFLRRLVTALTAVMLVGIVIVVGLLVTRLTQNQPILPDQISLPPGVEVLSFTQGDNWYAIVTSDQKILIFDRLSGALTQTITLD